MLLVLAERTGGELPATTLGRSQLPVTTDPGDQVPSSGLLRYPHAPVHILTYMHTYIHVDTQTYT